MDAPVAPELLPVARRTSPRKGSRDALPATADEMILGDGAMGTALGALGEAAGMQVEGPPERWNLVRPGSVEAVHAAHVEAGAAWVQTNTFGAVRSRLARWGLEDRQEEIIRAAVGAARRAAGERPVLGCLGPAACPREEWACEFGRAAALLIEAGADGVILETMVSLPEALAAIRACRSTPVWVCFTPRADGGLHDGTSAAAAGRAFVAAGAVVVGVNCGAGPESLLLPVRELAAAVAVPVLAAPSAGLPGEDGRHPVQPDAFAKAAIQFRELGATCFAGCCGVDSRHLHAARPSLAAGGAGVQSVPSPLRSPVGSL